jgi:hypothetical protein
MTTTGNKQLVGSNQSLTNQLKSALDANVALIKALGQNTTAGQSSVRAEAVNPATVKKQSPPAKRASEKKQSPFAIGDLDDPADLSMDDTIHLSSPDGKNLFNG